MRLGRGGWRGRRAAGAGRVDATVPFQINGLHVVFFLAGASASIDDDRADPALVTRLDCGSRRRTRGREGGGPAHRSGVFLEVRVSEACREALEVADVRGREVGARGKNERARRGIAAYGGGRDPPRGHVRDRAERRQEAIKLAFAPKRRARPFQVTLEVVLERGVTRSVALVRGSCLGVDVSLSRETLDFGAARSGRARDQDDPPPEPGRRGRRVRVRRQEAARGFFRPPGCFLRQKGLGFIEWFLDRGHQPHERRFGRGRVYHHPSEGFAPRAGRRDFGDV